MATTINKAYKDLIKYQSRFYSAIQILEREFIFVGFDENTPHVDFVHDEIFLSWETSEMIHTITIEKAIVIMQQKGYITSDNFQL